jgi:hypothetical protein
LDLAILLMLMDVFLRRISDNSPGSTCEGVKIQELLAPCRSSETAVSELRHGQLPKPGAVGQVMPINLC